MILLYSFVVSLSVPLLKIVSLFSSKVNAWLEGRKDWQTSLKLVESNENTFNVWFHCASLGEYEQGKPLMQQIKQYYPSVKLYVTFFSPSGYEARKGDLLPHYIGYLPLDTAQNALDFIELARPKLAIFVKSELWPNFVSGLKKKRIPRILVSARFYEGQSIFTWKGLLALQTLTLFDFIFVQDPESKKLLRKKEIHCVLAGDTRYDTVWETKTLQKRFPLVEEFVNRKKTLVVGSCWEQDLDVLFPYINNARDIKVMIAPHDVGERMVRSIISGLKVPYLLYSTISSATAEQIGKAKVLVIDSIGMLAHLYKYGRVAYVGGAFKQGLHNILEPAVFGNPVLFGPYFDGFPEAKEMQKEGAAFSISNTKELEEKLDLLFDDEGYYAYNAERNRYFMESKKGATEKIMATIKTLVENKINS